MKPHAAYWPVAAFVISFFAVGFPYWQIPYAKVSLPKTDTSELHRDDFPGERHPHWGAPELGPHYSRGFVTKPPRRQARRAHGAAREGVILLKRYNDQPSGEPARRQACRSGVSAIAVEAFVNNAG